MGAYGEALRRRKCEGAVGKMLKNFIYDLRKWGWHTAFHNALFMLLYDYSGAKHMHMCYEGEECIHGEHGAEV